MHVAYNAVYIHKDYLDVLESQLGPEKWTLLKDQLIELAEEGFGNWLIFDFPTHTEEPNREIILDSDSVDELFYTTLGKTEGTTWLITRKS